MRAFWRPYHLITAIGSRHPFAFGVAVACAKTAVADLFVQNYVEKIDKINKRRCLLFALWGFIWLGGVQYFLFVKCYSRWFPRVEEFARKSIGEKLADTNGQLNVVKQVLFDALVHMPWFYLPAFYTLKSILETEGATTVNDYLQEAKVNWCENLSNDLKVCWQWWTPAVVASFSICPLWMRIPFLAGYSLFFTMLWSFLHGEAIKQDFIDGQVNE